MKKLFLNLLLIFLFINCSGENTSETGEEVSDETSPVIEESSNRDISGIITFADGSSQQVSSTTAIVNVKKNSQATFMIPSWTQKLIKEVYKPQAVSATETAKDVIDNDSIAERVEFESEEEITLNFSEYEEDHYVTYYFCESAVFCYPATYQAKLSFRVSE